MEGEILLAKDCSNLDFDKWKCLQLRANHANISSSYFIAAIFILMEIDFSYFCDTISSLFS